MRKIDSTLRPVAHERFGAARSWISKIAHHSFLPEFFSSLLVLLSQKVATNDEENHLFGKIHTSAMGGWNGSAKIE